MINIQEFLHTRTVKLEAIDLIGFEGQELEDQHKLFTQLSEYNTRITTKKSENPYLVILPGLVPFVALECTNTNSIPEGMTTHTIPEEEYVVFRFKESYVGDFWSTICTEENQQQYNIDLARPRFEISTSDLQSQKLVEWYIPQKKN